jgi:hypothetical protein
MASFAELVRIVARATTHQVVEGSRHNARAALESRYEMLRQGGEVLAAVPAQVRVPAEGRHRPSA